MNQSAGHDDDLLRVVVDAIPANVFVVDGAFRIVLANAAAAQLVGDGSDRPSRRLCGEVLQCVHPADSGKKCGDTEFCGDCVVRDSVHSARSGSAVRQARTSMVLEAPGGRREVEFAVSATPLDLGDERLVLLVLDDLTEVLRLRALLPMCAGCKKIRSDEAYWVEVADYLARHTDLRFTHGYCPECLRKYFPIGGGTTS